MIKQKNTFSSNKLKKKSKWHSRPIESKSGRAMKSLQALYNADANKIVEQAKQDKKKEKILISSLI